MIKTIIECDGCGRAIQTSPEMVGSHMDWIKIHRHQSSSGEKISAGESHFCSEKCLLKALMRPELPTIEEVQAMIALNKPGHWAGKEPKTG